MSEAKQLGHSAGSEPTLYPVVSEALAEPRVSGAEPVEAPLVSASEATLLQEPPGFARRFTTQLLVLFLVGLCTFAAGAAIAGALVSGVLDSHTAHLKDLMHQLKDMVHLSPGP